MSGLVRAVMTLFALSLSGLAIAADGIGTTPVTADGAIAWVLPELGPMVEDKDREDGQGYGFALTAALQALLPNEKHAPVIVMPVARIVGFAVSGRLVCSIGLLQSSERVKHFAFSKAFLRILPNRLIMRGETVRELQIGPDGVDLAAMVEEGRRIAVVRGRAFGLPMDTIVKANADRVDWVLDSQSALVLVARGRADATIDYATGLVDEQRLNQSLAGLESVTIKGTALLNFQVACTANSRGRAIINQFNATMDARISEIAFSGYRQGLDRAADEFLRQALIAEDFDFPALMQPVRRFSE